MTIAKVYFFVFNCSYLLIPNQK